MIKHTPHDHPDHGNLQLALGEIKQLADRMNKGEKEDDQAEREAERLREIEASIENMADVSQPSYSTLGIDTCMVHCSGITDDLSLNSLKFEFCS